VNEKQNDTKNSSSLFETWMKTAPDFWSSVSSLLPGATGAFWNAGGEAGEGGLGSIPDVLSKVVESGMNSFSALQQQWMSQLQKTGAMTGTPDVSDIDKEALQAWSDLYDKEFRKFLKIPQLGLTRFHQEKINLLNDRFNLFQTAMAEFIRLLCTPFGKTITTMQEKLADLAGKGDHPEDSQAIYQMWIKALEGHYMILFKTPEYTGALAKTLGALEGYTSARQEVVDGILKLFSMPTKKDMDEVYRELYLLKKRLKHLEKTIQNQ